jgi:hypothetical protein
VSLTIFLVLAAMLLTMAASYLAVQYVVSLPFAPECPTCKCVTAQPIRPRLVDRVFAVGGADVRHCPRCGWTGRMRWRLAAERVRGNG